MDNVGTSLTMTDMKHIRLVQNWWKIDYHFEQSVILRIQTEVRLNEIRTSKCRNK